MGKLSEEGGRNATDLEASLKTPISESTRNEMHAIADFLKSNVPEFVEVQPESPLPWIELDHEVVAVQINIGERAIEVTLPYFRKDPEARMQLVLAWVEALQSRGFIAFDPQLNRIIGAGDLEMMVTHYQRVDQKLPSIVGEVEQILQKIRKPRWRLW